MLNAGGLRTGSEKLSENRALAFSRKGNSIENAILSGFGSGVQHPKYLSGQEKSSIRYYQTLGVPAFGQRAQDSPFLIHNFRIYLTNSDGPRAPSGRK